MPDIPAVRAQLEKAKREERIIRLTAEQVIKDFARFGMEVIFPKETSRAYEDLHVQLALHLERLLSGKRTSLEALLYQIDLNQKKVLPILGRENAALEISDMILERELVKVLTRIYFSEKQQGL